MYKLAVFLLCLVGFGCGMMKGDRAGVNGNSNQVAANAAAEAELSKKYYAIYDKRAELAVVPKAVQIAAEPYLKGKVLFLKTRKSHPPQVANPTPVVDKYSPPPGPSEVDQFKAVLATSIDDIGTIVLIEDPLYSDGCKETEKDGLYETKAGKAYLGFVQQCVVTIIDRSIPAVIFTKKFEAKQKDRAAVSDKEGYVLAKVDVKEMYDFLATLPRR